MIFRNDTIPLGRLEPGAALAAYDDTVNHRNKWREIRSKSVALYRNNIGLLLVALAGAFASMMSALVKKLNSIDPPVPMLELIFVRMATTWLCCMLYMWMTRVPDPLLGPQDIRGLLALRGFLGFIGLAGNYLSLQYLSVSDATVLQFLTPMCVGVAGALLLKEHLTRGQIVASLISLFGVVLIARPSFLGMGGAAQDSKLGNTGVKAAQRLTAVGFAVVAVAGNTGAFTTIRAIGTRAHALHSVAAFSTQSVAASTLVLLISRTPIVIPNKVEWAGMFVGIGFCGFFYQMLLTMGLQRETAGRGTMAVYVQIVYATINDFVFFHTPPTLLSVVGTIVIISSAMYVALSKKESAPSSKPKDTLPSQDHTLEEGLLENQGDGDDVPEVASLMRSV
ncbi:hypothetical protein C8Q72DRAFT_918240 [Fomitopsis betulina]|nr:hypothetical protein C8Q72DRAFT_918240 [Fomitopsis betulina]